MSVLLHNCLFVGIPVYLVTHERCNVSDCFIFAFCNVVMSVTLLLHGFVALLMCGFFAVCPLLLCGFFVV